MKRRMVVGSVLGWVIGALLVTGMIAGCSNEQETTPVAKSSQTKQQLAAIATPAFRNLGKRGESDL